MYSQDLLTLCDHLAASQLSPVIDSTYPLEEAKTALEYLREGKAKGKLILLTSAYIGGH